MYVAYFIRLIIMSYFYYYPDFIVLKFLFFYKSLHVGLTVSVNDLP